MSRTEAIRNRLLISPAFVEDCILKIDSLQTDQERTDKVTRELNGVGWRYVDAKGGSIMADFIRRCRKGSVKYPARQPGEALQLFTIHKGYKDGLERGRALVMHYVNQLEKVL